MISNLQLPNSEEFDVDTTLTLTRRQKKETLALLSAYPERYRWIQPHTTFDYIAPKAPNMYDLHFRVVRFRISDGCYETIYTDLDPETFPVEKIKELYRLRWGIETSFAELKHIIGLSCLHGKKTDDGKEYYSLTAIFLFLFRTDPRQHPQEMSANLLRVHIKHLRRIGVLFCPAHKALFAKHKVMVDMSILIHFINLIFLQEKKLVVV